MSGRAASSEYEAESIEMGNAFASATAHRPVRLRDADAGGLGLVAQLAPHGAGEVARVCDALEADHVGAEESLEHLAPPRKLRVEPVCRERDVVEVADGQVGAGLAEHARDELQLVVLHPDRRALGGDLRGGDREASVDADVRVPPDAAIPGGRDHIVVQRPDRVVREALVVELDLFRAQRHRHERGAFELEGLELRVGHTGPADPRAVRAPHHRFEGGDQATGRAAPRIWTLSVRDMVDGQPVRDDDEISQGHVSAPVPCTEPQANSGRPFCAVERVPR